MVFFVKKLDSIANGAKATKSYCGSDIFTLTL